MKRFAKVVWSEGMHLGPQHFQVQNRYFEDLVQFAAGSLWYASWGLGGVGIEQDALRNGVLSLVSARGIFPDGMPFQIPECDRPPAPRNIADLFPAMRESLDFTLAIEALKDDAPNCAFPGAPAGAALRFTAETETVADEMTGRDEKPVRLACRNLRLLADTEVQAGDAGVLPLVRIRRDASGLFVADPRFIPPVLQISASDRIMALLRRLVEILEDKCRTIARPKDLGAGTISGFSAQGVGNAWFLHCVNSSLAPLRHLCFSKAAHPEELYRELCRLAGGLCTFGLDSHPSALPLYDHANLTDCLEELDHHIRAHLELVVPSNYVAIPLVQTANYFWEGEIADQRTLSRSRWIFAVRSKIGEADLISGVPRLVKICSPQFLEKLVSRALPGLKLSHLAVPPPAISPKLECQYFTIDKVGPCWDHMVHTRRVGVYVPGEVPDPDVEISVVLEA